MSLTGHCRWLAPEYVWQEKAERKAHHKSPDIYAPGSWTPRTYYKTRLVSTGTLRHPGWKSKRGCPPPVFLQLMKGGLSEVKFPFPSIWDAAQALGTKMATGCLQISFENRVTRESLYFRAWLEVKSCGPRSCKAVTGYKILIRQGKAGQGRKAIFSHFLPVSDHGGFLHVFPNSQAVA